MPPSNEGDAPPARWAAWLHALWENAAETAWQVQGGTGRAVLAGRADGERSLHLPAGLEERAAFAAAAHAAAHWRFGGGPQPRAGLKPVQQALLAVLEDARVEWLALQELPGLRALWLPFHTGADAPAGDGCDALLARLARSLLEGEGADGHPWLARARAGFFAPGGALAAATPAQVRELASRLGNDLGQMRLPFNPRTYRPHAAYRDDGSWLWEPEAAAHDSQLTLAARARREEAAAHAPLEAPAGEPVHYPEWDARIARYRRDWCQVRVSTEAGSAAAAPWVLPSRAGQRALARRIEGLRGRIPRPAGRAASGEEFHAMALVDARLQSLAGQAPDEHVYRRALWPPPRLAVQLLVDTSASTADPGPGGRPVVQDLVAMALASAAALEAAGHHSALAAFRSCTRARIDVRHLKHWHEPALAAPVVARCGAQRGLDSTRMGAALRHAAAEATRFAASALPCRPLVLLLTDGDAHDIDAPDPAYLLEDLRRAVAEAGHAGVAVRCLQLAGPGGAGALRRAFAGGLARVRSPQGLARALVPLLAL